ncbi:MAG: NlpC/P60 family protein [Marinibacterium sp.]
MSGEKVVAAARRWIGTPYVHQASCLGGGADCLGLIRGIWREVVGPEPARVPAYSMDWSEPQGEERLWQAAGLHLRARAAGDPASAGDVILFRMRTGAVAKHLGIVSEPGAAFIHAYSRRGVVESPLSGPWQRRIVAHFAFPSEAL